MEDLKTMEQLFRQHYRAMYRLGVMLLHDEAESKDIVHDVFAELMATGRVVHPTTAETFLLTSVRNRCLNAMRNRQLHERVQRLGHGLRGNDNRPKPTRRGNECTAERHRRLASTCMPRSGGASLPRRSKVSRDSPTPRCERNHHLQTLAPCAPTTTYTS